MAIKVKGNGLPTIVDIMNLTDPDGGMAKVAEILNETNDILEDIPVFEANDTTTHTSTIRTKLPNATVRRFNRGVASSNGETAKVKDGIGMYEQRSQIDVEEAALNNNSAEWRLSEDRGHIEAMSQKLAGDLFYGNENDSGDSIAGLATRYSTKDGNIGKQIIDAGGTTGKLMSIFLVVWDQDTICGRHPKGQAKELLTMKDLGERQKDYVDEVTKENLTLDIMESVYKSKLGLSIKDYRYVVRIANIPVSLLDKEGKAVDLWDLVNSATWKIPNIRSGKAYFYMPRTARAYFDKQSINKPNVQLKQTEVDGKLLDSHRGVYFRTCDAMLETEEQVK